MSNASAQYLLSCGRKLGRNYKIIDFIGYGWEGEVYAVEEIETGVIRAAKLFYKHQYTSKALPHVEYARKLHRLQACSIVLQYHHQDTITIKGERIDFLISDFVDGEPLSKFIENQKCKRINPFEALH